MRLRELGRTEPEPPAAEATLLPNGQLIGVRNARASGGARTVSPSGFQDLLAEISPGAEVIKTPEGYEGHWYRRTDGFVFGIRRSRNHGITFETIKNDNPIIGNGFKVHQKSPKNPDTRYTVIC